MPDISAVQSGFGRIIGKLAGEDDLLAVDLGNLVPYLPGDMVAGSVPHIPGMEQSAVWHAAVQACGTEKVQFCYSAEGGRVWYLAAPSSSFASAVDSWCPLAAALPGQSEHWDKDTVYLYEQEGQASALRWDPESGRMQLFLGPSRTILPRIQSMNANFVTVNPENARPVPWINRNLKMERMARYVSLLLLLSGTLFAIGLILYVLFLNVMLIAVNPALDNVKKETVQASEQLITQSYQAFASNVPKYLVRVQELHQELYAKGGILLRFEVKQGGTLEWEAFVPQAVIAADNPVFRGAKPTGEINSEDGRVRIMGTQ